MRWTRWTSYSLSAAAILVAVGALSCSQQQSSSTSAPAAMTAEQKVVRGKYLTTIMGCNDCHTPGTFYGEPDTTRRLSGTELGWHGPWGVSYPRTLTPDQQTGIGSWTEDQIVHALRTGMRPDGSILLPPMPWPMYGGLTDDDAYSIAAYLKSIPPVSHKAPDRIPPTGKVPAAVLSFPPPPAWDAMHLTPPGSAPPGGAAPDTSMHH